MTKPGSGRRKNYRQIYVGPQVADAVTAALPDFIGRTRRNLTGVDIYSALITVGLSHPEEVAALLTNADYAPEPEESDE